MNGKLRSIALRTSAGAGDLSPAQPLETINIKLKIELRRVEPRIAGLRLLGE
jgi:hypothetical protein